MLLEIACFRLEDVLLAQKSGADRIEFCEDYDIGGITPIESDIKKAREEIQIPLFVMIRPLSSGYVYTEMEIEEMKEQIFFCKQQKCDGVVFGVLTKKNEVNKEQCKELVELAKPMQCTFHRAFDETPDLFSALEDVIACGFTRILTSGGKGNAEANIPSLRKVIDKAGDRILIMPGGGIRSGNAKKIAEGTGCRELHTAAIDRMTRELIVQEVYGMKKILSK